MPLPDVATPTPPQQQAPQITPPGQAPMGYQDLYDAHQRFLQSNPSLAHVSLHDFSQIANEATGSKVADQGLNENFVRNLVAQKNDLIRPVTDFAGGLGQGIDQLLGTSKAQGGSNPVEGAFKGIPESLANMAVVAAPTAIEPLGGEAMSAAIAPLVFGGDAAINTYGDTGSVAGAAASGAVGAVMPRMALGGAKVGGELANKYLSRETSEGSQELLPNINPVLGKLASYVGAQTGIATNMQLANVATATAVSGLPGMVDSLKHIASVDNVVGTAASILPFAAWEASPFKFGHTDNNDQPSYAQALRTAENLQRSEALQQSIKDSYLTTATKNNDVQAQTENPVTPLTPDQVEKNLNLQPSGKNAEQSANTIKLGLNDIVASKEGGKPHKNAAASAEIIADKLAIQDDPSETLFQQPIEQPEVKSAAESAQVFEDAEAERQRVAQSPIGSNALNNDLSKAQQNRSKLDFGIKGPEWPTQGGEVDYDEYGKERSTTATEEGGGSKIRGPQSDRSNPEEQRQNVGAEQGQQGDNLVQGEGKEDESVPLTLSPEVVDMAHNPPSDAEGVQEMMQTNNDLKAEAKVIDTNKIRNNIQATHEFEDTEMQPFTDEWITAHYNFNREQGLTDSENYQDIVAKAQVVFRDNVNKVNAQLLAENDRRKQSRDDANKQTQQGKQTFQDRIEGLNEELKYLSPEDRAQVEKDMTAVLKEKGSGQQTQGEANVYEAISYLLRKKRENPDMTSKPTRGFMAKAYDLGTREEMRSKSAPTEEYEKDEHGNIVKDSKGVPKKVTKMPLSIDAPVGEEGKATFGDHLQEVHFGAIPESEWVDKEAERIQGSNPTAQETQRKVIIDRVNRAINTLKNLALKKGSAEDKKLILNGFKKARISEPRNLDATVNNLIAYVRADMLQLESSELVKDDNNPGGVTKEDGITPLSKESIHGERTKAREIMRGILEALVERENKGAFKESVVSETKVPKKGAKISLDDIEALEEFLEKDKIKSPGTNISFVQNAHEVFSVFANKLGLKGQESKVFVDISKRIAATMESVDRARILGLSGINALGVGGDVGNRKSMFIGLFKDPKVLEALHGSKDVDFTKFLQLYIMGHETTHMYEYQAKYQPDSAQAKAFNKLTTFATSMSAKDRFNVIDEILKKTLPLHVLLDDNVKNLVAHMSQEGARDVAEFVATVNGLIHLGLASSQAVKGKTQEFKEYLLFSPNAIQDFSRGAYLNLMKFGGALQTYWRNLSARRVKERGIDVEKMVGFMQEATTFIKQFGRIPEEIDQKIGELSTLQNLYPEVYLNHWDQNGTSLVYNSTTKNFEGAAVSMASAIGVKEKTPDELFKKNAGMWNLMTSGHWAQKFSEMADVIDLSHSFGSIVNEYIAKAVAPFLTKFDSKGNLVRDTKAEGLQEFVRDKKTYNILNKILQWQNANDSKLMDSDTLKKFTAGLNPQQAKMVKHYRDAISSSMTDMATRMVAGKQNELVKAAANLIQSENPILKYGQYMGLASDLVNAHLSAGSSDPRTAMMAQAKLAQIMQTASPGMLSASRLTESLIPEFQTFQKQFLDRPGYSPETRQGPYMVSWKEVQQDGSLKPYTLGYKTKAEATARYNKALGDGRTVEANDLKAYDRNAQGKSAQGITSAVVEALRRFDNAAFKAAMQIAPDSAKDFQQYFQSGEGLLKELQSRGYRKNLMTRNLSGGREELDTFQEVFNYIQSMSRGLGKQEVRGQLMLRSNEAKVLAEPNLRNDAIQHVENTINPPVAEFNKLKEGIFQYFLGANLSSLVVDASHPVLSLAPFLIEKGSGVVGAYKNMAFAGAKIVTSLGKGLQRAATIQDFEKAVGDKDLARGLFMAKQERLLDHGILDEFRTSDDLDLLNLKAVATEQGGVFNSTADLLKNAGYQYLRATRQLFGTVSKYNNLNTYIASFKTARDQGNSVDDAHAFASKAVNTVLPQGGRGSRPVVFSKLGKAQSLFGVMYSLQSYTTGLLSMHARLAADSLGQTGLSGKALSDARKALGTAVLSQVALSGLLGLPFAGALIAGLQNIFPELQLSRMLREHLTAFGGSDKELGDTIADTALKGLPAMLAGVDLSGRLGLGNILGTNPYNGFDASALLGPTGSLVQKMVLGMGAAAQGNLQGAAENMLPIAYKNLLDAYAFDKVGRDKDGNLLTQPTDATRFLSAVGIKTTEETNARDQQGMLRQSARANAVELKAFYNQVADQIQTGNMDGARTLLYQRSQTDPSFSPQAGVKAAVQVLQSRQAPKDMLARVGLTNAEDANKIAALFPPGQQSQPSQVQDELQKSMLERLVGVPGVGMTPQAKMKEAQAVDYLVSSYGVSPSQARAMLSHTIDARQKLQQRQQAWTSGVAVPTQ